MGRAPEEPQPPQDQYNHNYDQAQETPSDTYYVAPGDDQPEVTNYHYDPENTPPPPPPQRAPPPLPPQPVQFPPPSPPPQPQAYPPQQGQSRSQPQPQPQAFPPQQGQPQAFPPQQYGQPQAFPPQQYGQPQAFPPQQYGQPQAFPPQQYGQPQGYMPAKANMGYDDQGQGTPNYKPATPTGFPLQQPVGTNAWNSDLFDCMDDPENALITACFPCVTYGQIAEIVDNGQSSCATSGFIYGAIAFIIACPCIISCAVRTKIRNRYGLVESPAPDWITHCFCEWCALCQEYRELNSRGLDPAIGWQGNVMKQQNLQMQQQATMAAPMNQTMM